MNTEDKLNFVKKYLDTGCVSANDSLSLGIDPWKFPNFKELYVARLYVIIDELSSNLEK